MKDSLNLSLFDNNLNVPFENEYIEYKENMSDGIAKNIHESICAFLNRNGGYIIVGISDSRNIIGINMKLYDRFINNTLDSIYTQAIIIKNENSFINPFLIKPIIHITKENKTLLILDVTTDLPKIENDYRSIYSLKNGYSYFRLNASNKKITSNNRLFLFNELESLKITRIENEKIKLEELLYKNKLKYNELNRVNYNLEIENEKLTKVITNEKTKLINNIESESICEKIEKLFSNCFKKI